jgi:hypothetical protein
MYGPVNAPGMAAWCGLLLLCSPATLLAAATFTDS